MLDDASCGMMTDARWSMMEVSVRQTKRWMSILGIQALVFIFSLASMMSKVAAQQLKTHGLLSVPFVASLAAIFAF